MIRYDHLVGIHFEPGVHDCFSLGRQFFVDNFGLVITDYARPTDWRADNLDLIGAAYEREGFEKITDWREKDLRPGDVFCMAIGESKPNHFAIYVGDNMILHQLLGRMSAAEPYRDFWRNCTSYLLRHPSVPDLRPTPPEHEIGSLLRARYNLQAAEPVQGD
jgi:cell wall-associated NlpC family hydrolase